MRKAIKTEFWKAFHNPLLWLALAGGAVVVIISVRDCIVHFAEWKSRVYGSAGVSLRSEGYSLFVFALPYDRHSFSAGLFRYIWPILAAMPYGSSYIQERRSGVYNQVVTRIGRKKYFFAKYLAVFVTGGAVLALTQAAALLADAMVLPYWKIHVTLIEVLTNGAFLSELFYENAWLHALAWFGMVFLLGGSAACLTFFAWTGLRLWTLVSIVPFAIIFVTNAVLDRITSAGIIHNTGIIRKAFNVLNIMEINHPAYPGFSRLLVVGVIVAATLAVGYIQVVKHELD